MSSRYLVSEMVSSINVAIKAHFSTVLVPRSNFVLQISNILYQNGFIRGFSIQPNNVLLHLKYQNSKSVISSLKVVSKSGKRTYWRLNKLNMSYNYNTFAGTYIVSTPKGLLTSTECLLLNQISGEIILKVEC